MRPLIPVITRTGLSLFGVGLMVSPLSGSCTGPKPLGGSPKDMFSLFEPHVDH